MQSKAPVRDANAADIEGIVAIYNDAVTNSTAIWNEAVVDAANRAAWLADRQRLGYPVVVATDDCVLVAAKDRVQDVKGVVDRLKQMGRKEHAEHPTVYRPWGSYRGIGEGPRFQVKRIVVKPGASLSLQMHHHRAEHWIVVSGTGRVTKGDETFLLYENQSTFIPMGMKHRLENHGHIPLELIEVQSGGYLGEDDIVRFADTYGRS